MLVLQRQNLSLGSNPLSANPDSAWVAALAKKRQYGGTAMTSQETLYAFDRRFLDRHAGPIISDLSVEVVELVANAWDAYATTVDITWPTADGERKFAIKDNGRGMTAAQFEQRWGVLDYNRVTAEGEFVGPPKELASLAPRRAYGRNGRGRHGGFAFSNPYDITIEAGGEKVTYRVSRGGLRPFDWQLMKRQESPGHGVEIKAVEPTRLRLSAGDIREVLGTRFLTDPNFRVFVDAQAVTFDDIRRAETRMLNLYAQLSQAPFLQDAGVDVAAFVAEPTVIQPRLGVI